MPAVQVLRATVDRQSAAPLLLTFWTPLGPATWNCRVHPSLSSESLRHITILAQPANCSIASAHPLTQVCSHAPAITAETVARLGHELRTPLAAIVSLADVMAQGHFGPLANARYQDYAHSIRNTARHSLSVIGAMLDPAMPGAPAAKPTFTEIDINGVVAEAVHSVEPMAAQIGLNLSMQLAHGLPRLIADRVAIQQIVLNLLSNGLQHVGAGGNMALATGGIVGGETWIEVTDDGPGMPQQVLATLAASSAAAGLEAYASTPRGGLGLRLARTLAEVNGGRLAFSARPPRGTLVRVTFGPSRAVII